MELYTLTPDFFPDESVHDFTSAIWTERYSSAGDVQIVVPADSNQIAQLAPGTFVGLRGTKEIMILETQSIEAGLLTVSGSSLPKFLNQREAWFKNPAYDGSDTTVPLSADRVDASTTAGQLISSVVHDMVISPVAFVSPFDPINLDWSHDQIPGLELGVVDANGTPTQLTFPRGPLYDNLAQLASDQGVGFKLYLSSANYSTHSYVLKFATYRGKNRTSAQTVNRMVRLSPDLDSLNNPKELDSNSKYKNVVYVTYKNLVSVHYDKYTSTPPAGFTRRAIRVDAPDIYLDPSHIAAFREQVARNTFIDNPYVLAVDGQVPTKIPYNFGTDYYLGDIVELEGSTGLLFNVRVTEYIRSQDQYGERAFPTLAAIDPLKTGYMPDTEPNPDFPIDWIFDPSFDVPDLTLALDDVHLNPIARKKPLKKKIPGANPLDPVPDFHGWPGPGDTGPPSGDSTFPAGAFLATGFYPDQTNEALGYVVFSDHSLKTAWIYPPEDPDNAFYQEVIPKGWTADHKIIARSDETKSSSSAFPWTQGAGYWLVDGSGGPVTRLTDTIDFGLKPDGSGGWYHYEQDVFWAGSASSKHLYLNHIYGATEYLYCDGTYSTDYSLHDYTISGDIIIRSHPFIDDPGPVLTSGLPTDIYHCTSGHMSDLTQLLGVGAFPEKARWGATNVFPSPDGSKLFIERGSFAPKSGRWGVIGGRDAPVGGGPAGTFRLMFGLYGSYPGYYTFPIAADADAETVWEAIITAQVEYFSGATPYLDDPRDHGFTGTPWSGGPLSGSGTTPVGLYYNVVASEGVWMDIDTHDLVNSLWIPVGVQNNALFSSAGGPTHTYICNADGSGLTEIDLSSIPDRNFNSWVGWTPDGSKLSWVVADSSDRPYYRLMMYDIASHTISFPLDYSTTPPNAYGYGPMNAKVVYSPNSTKMVWLLDGTYGGMDSLWLGNIDGSGATKIYQMPSSPDESDQSTMFLSNRIVWSFDSHKIAVVDNRDQAPVWVFDTVGGTWTKVFNGTGWTDPSQEKWIYDPLTFNG